MSVFAQMFRQRTREARTARLRLETLEARETPATLSGTAWPKPERVTISFTPDGTNLGGPTSNLFSAFNAKFGSATTWQNQILKAAQQWAQHTNLNFAVVSDNGAAIGSGTNVQGDSNFGDIRIGGYNFGTTTLAQAYLPPPVINFSTAGDFQFNTGQTWNIGSTYDLHTVAMHEFGHALGLYHGAAGSAMDGVYNSALATVQPDDISGIQSVVGYPLTNGITSPGYGGTRDHDAFDAAASNNTSGTAKDLTSLINTGNKTLVVGGLDITSTSDVDWYRFTAPAGSATTMTVKVQSSGLSLLAPKFQLYTSSLGTLGTLAIGSGFQGSTLSRTVSITAGQTYYLMVDGNTNDAMGTGAYGLSVQFASTVPGAIPPPNTTTAEGSPRVNGGGQAVGLGPEVLVNNTTTGSQWTSSFSTQASAMAPNGNFVVTWMSDGQDGSGYGVYARLFGANGAPLGNEFQVNTTTAGNQWEPTVAVDAAGNFLIVWVNENAGIFGRRFNSAGVPLGGEFLINNAGPLATTTPTIAMNASGAFVVGWTAYATSSTDADVYVRRYDATGTPLGNAFRANATISGAQTQPAIAMNDSGAFVLAWSTLSTSTWDTNVFVRRFNSSGTPLANEVRVNVTTTDEQSWPDVGMDANGRFVVAWNSYWQDGSMMGVYARQYDAAGTPLSGEFRVNTTTANFQHHPSIAIASGGNFFVTWESLGQDNTDNTHGVYAQQYTPAGVPQGSEFRVNSTTLGQQYRSSMSLNGNGEAVIVWTGNGAGDADGIFAQRYMVSYGGMNPLEPHRFDPEGHDHDHEHGAECAEDIHLTLDDDHHHESDEGLGHQGPGRSNLRHHEHEHDREHGRDCTCCACAGHSQAFSPGRQNGLSSHDIESAQAARASVEDFDAVALGTLDELEPVHVYRFQVPRGAGGKFLTVGTLALSNDQDAPSLALFDTFGRPVPMTLVMAEPRTFAAQTRPDWAEGMTFYLKAFGPRGRTGGDYCLGVDFSCDSLA